MLRQLQLSARRGAHRLDHEFMAADALDHPGAQRPLRVDAVIDAEVPRAAARRLEPRHHHVLEQHRRTEGRHAICGVADVGRALELRERADRRRRPFVEQPEPAVQHRVAGLVEQNRRADARRQVPPIDDAVAVDAAAKLEYHRPLG